MRSLIIIAAVMITFIAISLILPFRHDRQPGAAADTILQAAAAPDSSRLHAAQPDGSALTSAGDTLQRNGDSIHYTRKHPSALARSISL